MCFGGGRLWSGMAGGNALDRGDRQFVVYPPTIANTYHHLYKDIYNMWSIAKRAFATAAAETATGGTRQLRVTIVCPHQTFIKDTVARQVNVSTEDGDLGILAGHLPMVLQLRPGVIEVVPGADQADGNAKAVRLFGSGGFATVNPDSSLQVAAMEAVPVEQIDGERVKAGLAEAEQMAGKAQTEEEKMEAGIQLMVYKAMLAAVEKKP